MSAIHVPPLTYSVCTPLEKFKETVCTYMDAHTHTNTPANPPRKRRKVEKKSRAEKAMEKAVESFAKHQREAEERFQKYEEERWTRETELEEKRRREDQEHEIRMVQLLGQMFQGRNYHSLAANTGTYDYNQPDNYHSSYYKQ